MSDIVIDADIMRSAGTSENPHSGNARRALEAIWKAGHRIVQCRPIKEEYDRHQGRYASLWRTKMVSRKRWTYWNYAEDVALRHTLVAALPETAGTSQERAVRKDAHLLEAAAATDKRIVSKDSKAKILFQHACPNLGMHRHIHWGDLTGAAKAVIEWIADGCNERDEFKLCPPPPRKRTRRRATGNFTF